MEHIIAMLCKSTHSLPPPSHHPSTSIRPLQLQRIRRVIRKIIVSHALPIARIINPISGTPRMRTHAINHRLVVQAARAVIQEVATHITIHLPVIVRAGSKVRDAGDLLLVAPLVAFHGLSAPAGALGVPLGAVYKDILVGLDAGAVGVVSRLVATLVDGMAGEGLADAGGVLWWVVVSLTRRGHV